MGPGLQNMEGKWKMTDIHQVYTAIIYNYVLYIYIYICEYNYAFTHIYAVYIINGILISLLATVIYGSL